MYACTGIPNIIYHTAPRLLCSTRSGSSSRWSCGPAVHYDGPAVHHGDPVVHHGGPAVALDGPGGPSRWFIRSGGPLRWSCGPAVNHGGPAVRRSITVVPGSGGPLWRTVGVRPSRMSTAWLSTTVVPRLSVGWYSPPGRSAARGCLFIASLLPGRATHGLRGTRGCEYRAIWAATDACGCL